MNFFESIVYAAQNWKLAETPGNYGVFHLISLACLVAVTVLLCVFFRDADDKTFRRIVLIFGLIMIVFEAYKQIQYSFNFSEEKGVWWDYQWYAFPYQFCSTPFICLPLIALLKDGKFRDGCMAFMSFFCLFAGVAVMLYPNDCYVKNIIISTQSMVHHGIQVAMGIFITVYNRKKLTLNRYLLAIPVFVGLSALAMIMNELAPLVTDEVFNMFFISPHFPCTLPVLSSIYPLVPYPVFLVLYFLGFCLAAFIMFWLEKGLAALFCRKKGA